MEEKEANLTSNALELKEQSYIKIGKETGTWVTNWWPSKKE